MSVGDTSGIGEKISNNTNNIGESQSSRVNGANKDELGKTVKGEIGETDIKAGVGVGRDNIQVSKKANVGAIISIDNSADSSSKITNSHLGLANLPFATLDTANCNDNSNLVVPKKTPSGAATFIADKFLAFLATLANTTFEKK